MAYFPSLATLETAWRGPQFDCAHTVWLNQKDWLALRNLMPSIYWHHDDISDFIQWKHLKVRPRADEIDLSQTSVFEGV